MRTKGIRALLLSLCAVLLICTIMFSAMAYLQQQTGIITNTFTAGSVGITLTEGTADSYGTALGGTLTATTDVSQAFILVPGNTYNKNTTVTVTAGSEACYVFVKVVNPYESLEATPTIASQIGGNGWSTLGTTTAGAKIYYRAVPKSASAQPFTVFSTFSVSTSATVANGNITVQAFAVQQANLTDAAAAYSAAVAGTFGTLA